MIRAVIALAAVLAADDSPGYRWPLDIPPILTSSFGEYRAGRFHAAIDLSTYSRIGQPVYASADGYVSRIRCSPFGYGKVVYVTQDDGNTTVYAHLSQFRPGLQNFVYAGQHAQRTYDVNLYPARTQFPVAKGDLLGESGQTGVGVPHLHYEIRDALGRPINPRKAGLRWEDTTSPRFRKVLIVPKDPNTRLNGDLRSLILTPERISGTEYRIPPIFAEGAIGFALDVIDPSNGGRNRLGVYTVSSRFNDEEIFFLRNDHISYERMHHGSVAFHPFFLDEGRFLVQWRWSGNRVAPYLQTEHEGWLSIPEQGGEVEITAADFMGNAATLTIPIEFGSRSAPNALDTGTRQTRVDIDTQGTWLLVSAEFASPEHEPPTIVVNGDPARPELTFDRIDDHTFRVGYVPSSEAEDVTLRVDHPRLEPFERRIGVARGGKTSLIPLEGVLVELHEQAPFGIAYVSLERKPNPNHQNLESAGEAYNFWPDATPFDHPARVTFAMAERDTHRLGLYRKSGADWRWEDVDWSPGAATLTTRSMGTFAFFYDRKPPRINRVNLDDGIAVSTKRPTLRANVWDRESGVDGIEVTCGGQWLIMEYDPERALVQWAQDHDLPSGKQTLTFRVSDRAGNETLRRQTIVVP